MNNHGSVARRWYLLRSSPYDWDIPTRGYLIENYELGVFNKNVKILKDDEKPSPPKESGVN